MRLRLSALLRCGVFAAMLFNLPAHLLSADRPSSLTRVAAAAMHRPMPNNPQLASSPFMIEVRLRKLHLARPDLIPYPIELEVYC
jgi:hypothetical protein